MDSAQAYEGRTIVFTASLDKANSNDHNIGFKYRINGGSATSGVDFTDSGGNFRGQFAYFRPGEIQTEVFFLTHRDGVYEGDETVILELHDADGLELTTTTVVGTILDRDEDPNAKDVFEISVIAHDDVTEGSDAVFSVESSPRPETPLRVKLNVSQTGNVARGGQLGNRFVTVGTNGSGKLRVGTIDDGANESQGSITASIVAGSDYEPTSESRYRSATVHVADNDLPLVSITAGSSIQEGSSATFHLRASPSPAREIEVSVDVNESKSFLATGENSTKIVVIDRSGRGTLRVATESDSLDEDDGVITATLLAGSGYSVTSPTTANVRVSDGGVVTPEINIRRLASPINEGNVATFTLTANPAPETTMAVDVMVEDSGDFAQSGETGYRTAFIGTSGSGSLSVNTIDDQVAETDGRITATIQSGSGYTVGSASSAFVVVADLTPQVVVSGGPAINEGEDATFTVSTSPVATDLTVSLRIAQTGDFLAGGEVGLQSVYIDSTGSATYIVSTIDDGILESNGSISLQIENGSGYMPGSPSKAAIAVSDTTPFVSISSKRTAVEGEEIAFTLLANPVPVGTLFVDVALTVQGDFVVASETESRSVGIDPFTGQGTFTVQTIDDENDESSGAITARIVPSEGNYYGLRSPSSIRVVINDDDKGSGKASVSILDGSIEENARNGQYGRTVIEFPVVLSQPLNHWVQVSFETQSHEDSPGSNVATPGTDYVVDTPVKLGATFFSGETEKTIRVQILDDDLVEAAETFDVVITKISGAEIADARAIGTILPDPNDVERSTPVITISGAGVITEGESAVFKLRAEPPPREDLVVHLSVYDELLGGYPSSDYLALENEGDQTVTIPGVIDRYYPRISESTARFSVPTIDDEENEAGGAVRVVIQLPGDASYEAHTIPYEATIDVRDNDSTIDYVLPQLSISDASEPESSGQMTFVVTANPAIPFDGSSVSVRYQTLTWPGSAQANVDFEDHFGTVVFRPGENSKNIDFVIIDDAIDEGNEVFRVRLDHLRGDAILADDAGEGVIVNSDPMPSAWMSRLGRSVAQHTIEGITDRVSNRRNFDLISSFAGHAYPNNQIQSLSDSSWFRGNPNMQIGMNHLTKPQYDFAATEGQPTSQTAFWGRSTQSEIAGDKAGLSIDGTITTHMLGSDYAIGKWLVGLSVAQSKAEGRYGFEEKSAGTQVGQIDTTLNSLVPYFSYQLTPRTKTWTAIGRGAGEIDVQEALGPIYQSDVTWTMIAGGFRSDLWSGNAVGAPKLVLVSENFQARTKSEETLELMASDTEVSQSNLGLEGSWRLHLGGSGYLQPKLQLGARYDGGEAENGFGVDVSGGIAMNLPALGLAIDIESQTLVVHAEESLRDSQFALSVAVDPTYDSLKGPSLTVRKEFGGHQASAIDQLMNGGTFDLRYSEIDQDRWTAEAAWGFGMAADTMIYSPRVGYTLAPSFIDYFVGWDLLSITKLHSPDLSVSLRLTRRDFDSVKYPESGIGASFNLKL